MPFDPDHTVEGKRKKEAEYVWKRLTYDYSEDRMYERALIAMKAVIYRDHDEKENEKK